LNALPSALDLKTLFTYS